MSTKYEEMLALVKRWHVGQTRDGGRIEYWTHCDRVARLLDSLLQKSGEGTSEEKEIILLAALGHDLYEDTQVSREEVRKRFGEHVDQLIEEATNEYGDDQAVRYAEDLKVASEEARLIKLADLVDNYCGGAYSIAGNGEEWTESFLWPILEAQWQVLQGLTCPKFPTTAAWLEQGVEVGRTMLLASLKQKGGKVA